MLPANLLYVSDIKQPPVLLNTHSFVPYKTFVLQILSNKRPVLQNFMTDILNILLYSPCQRHNINTRANALMQNPENLKDFLETLVLGRVHLSENRIHTTGLALHSLETIIEEHKRVYGIAYFLSILSEEVYMNFDLKTLKGTVLLGVLKDASFNLAHIRLMLTNNIIGEHQSLLLKYFAQNDKIIEQIFSSLLMRLENTVSLNEISKFLPSIEIFLSSFKNKAFLSFAQGRKTEATSYLEARKIYYKGLKPLFNSLKKKGKKDVINHYNLLGIKILKDEAYIMRHHKIHIQREYQAQILDLTELLTHPVKRVELSKNDSFKIDVALNTLISIQNLNSESIEIIKQAIELLIKVRDINFKNDLDYLKKAEIILKALEGLIGDINPNLITVQIQSHLNHYKKTLEEQENKIKAQAKKINELKNSALESSLQALQKENEALKQTIHFITKELNRIKSFNESLVIQAKTIERSNEKEIKNLRAENTSLRRKLGGQRDELPSFVPQKPLFTAWTPSSHVNSWGNEIRFQSSDGPTLSFTGDLKKSLQYNPTLLIDCLTWPCKYHKPFSYEDALHLKDAILEHLNQGLLKYCNLLSLITDHPRPWVMLESLHKEGFLHSLLDMPESMFKSPLSNQCMQFAMIELEKANKVCPFKVINCLLLTPYYVLKEKHPNKSSEKLIHSLSMHLMSKIKNTPFKDQILLNNHISKGLFTLVEEFKDWQEKSSFSKCRIWLNPSSAPFVSQNEKPYNDAGAKP